MGLQAAQLQLNNKLQTVAASQTDLTSKGWLLCGTTQGVSGRLQVLRSAEQQKLQ